jgi:hypothetical protein
MSLRLYPAPGEEASAVPVSPKGEASVAKLLLVFIKYGYFFPIASAIEYEILRECVSALTDDAGN